MASGAELLEFPFSAGIDEGTRDELVEPGAGWLVLENGRQHKRGAYGTRYGFTALTTTLFGDTSPTTGYRMFADRDTVVRVADGKAHVYSSTAARWRELTRVPEASYSLANLAALGTSSHIQDVEVCNGYIAVLYNNTSGSSNYTFAAILDATTLAVVRAPEQLFTGNSYGQVVSYGTRFIALAGDQSGNTIKLYVLNTSSVSNIETGWASLTTATNWNTNSPIQACSLSDRVAVAYVNNSGGTDQVTVRTYDSTGQLETVDIDTNSTTPTAVAVAGSIADTLWVSWNETGAFAVHLQGLDADSLASTLATSQSIITPITEARAIWICPSTTAGKGRLLVLDTNTQAVTQSRGFKTTAGAADTDGVVSVCYGAVACGKPFLYGGRYYAPFFSAGITGSNATAAVGNLIEYGGQATFILCDFSDGDTRYVLPVVNVSPGTAVQSTFMQGKFAEISTGKYITGMGIVASTEVYAPTLVTVDFTDGKRWQPAVVGLSTYLSGGVTLTYDGQRVFEAGFLQRPTKCTTSTSGTGITAATGWKYVAVYEFVDGDGNWHVSGVGDPSASTGAVTNKTVTVSTTPLGITAKGASTNQASSVRVAFYRTLDGGEPPYYRLGTTINNPTTSTITYADTTADSTLDDNQQLYRQPGVNGSAQDRRPPPGFSCIVTYQGLLVGAAGNNVWYSGQPISGEGTWFNPVFQFPVDGDVTGLSTQDGVLYVFTRRSIFAVAGEPPSDNGSSGGLGAPQRLAADVGCIDSRSIVVTSLGIFFQSERGIEVLTRARQVEYVGEYVKETLASYPVVTAATLDPAESVVYIELAAAESSGVVSGNGRTLVYDLTLKAWISVDRRKNSAGTADTPAQSACMIYTGSAWRYAWMGSNGTVYHENKSAYTDADGSFVAKRAISGNVKAGGLQGAQHVNRWMLLAKRHTAHDLNVDFAYDYSDTYKPVRLYTNAHLSAITSAIPNMQLDHPLHDDAQPCEAIRVRLQDVTPSTGSIGTGQGGTWVSVAFAVVPKPGGYLLPDESR